MLEREGEDVLVYMSVYMKVVKRMLPQFVRIILIVPVYTARQSRGHI